jgi:hypothetical protein
VWILVVVVAVYRASYHHDPLINAMSSEGLRFQVFVTTPNAQGGESEERSHIDRKDKMLAKATYVNWRQKSFFLAPSPLLAYFFYWPTFDAWHKFFTVTHEEHYSENRVDMTRCMANLVQSMGLDQAAIDQARKITSTKVSRERSVNESLLDSIRQQAAHNPVTRAEICSVAGASFDQEQAFWDPLAVKACC